MEARQVRLSAQPQDQHNDQDDHQQSNDADARTERKNRNHSSHLSVAGRRKHDTRRTTEYPRGGMPKLVGRLRWSSASSRAAARVVRRWPGGRHPPRRVCPRRSPRSLRPGRGTPARSSPPQRRWASPGDRRGSLPAPWQRAPHRALGRPLVPEHDDVPKQVLTGGDRIPARGDPASDLAAVLSPARIDPPKGGRHRGVVDRTRGHRRLRAMPPPVIAHRRRLVWRSRREHLVVVDIPVVPPADPPPAGEAHQIGTRLPPRRIRPHHGRVPIRQEDRACVPALLEAGCRHFGSADDRN